MNRLTILLLVLSGALWANAQTDTIVTRLDEVRVVGVKQSVETDLSTVTQISPKEIDRLNILTMKDASDVVPNFYIPNTARGSHLRYIIKAVSYTHLTRPTNSRV